MRVNFCLKSHSNVVKLFKRVNSNLKFDLVVTHRLYFRDVCSSEITRLFYELPLIQCNVVVILKSRAVINLNEKRER